jgi:hypothetical protein
VIVNKRSILGLAVIAIVLLLNLLRTQHYAEERNQEASRNEAQRYFQAIQDRDAAQQNLENAMKDVAASNSIQARDAALKRVDQWDTVYRRREADLKALDESYKRK